MACEEISVSRGYHCSQRQCLEEQEESVVDLHSVLHLALLLEAKVSRYTGTLVISSNEPHPDNTPHGHVTVMPRVIFHIASLIPVGVSHLVRQQRQNHFTGEAPPVNVIPQE